CRCSDSLLSLLRSSLLSSASLGGFVLSVLGFLLSPTYFLRVTRTSWFCRTRSRALQNRLWATDWFRRLRSRADRLWSRADRLWSRAALIAMVLIIGPQSGRSEAPQSECNRDGRHSPDGKFGQNVHIVSYIAE